MFPIDLFASLEARSRDLLSAKGYRRTRTDLSGPFDSRYAEYESARSRISIIWDGKENWLVLSVITLPLQPNSLARELYFERFSGRAGKRSPYEAAVEQLLEQLEAFSENKRI